MKTDEPLSDPFNTPPDPERGQQALIRSLQVADDFVLLFAVTNSATERNARIEAVAKALPGKNIQAIGITSENENLLRHLRDTLGNSKPDAVFIYGLENWISGEVNPRSIPFLLNLNAARDSFPLVLPAPMVLWVPQYVLQAIANAAPDFFSVRSGVYSFPLDPFKRDVLTNVLMRMDKTFVMSYPKAVRSEVVHEIRGLLK